LDEKCLFIFLSQYLFIAISRAKSLVCNGPKWRQTIFSVTSKGQNKDQFFFVLKVLFLFDTMYILVYFNVKLTYYVTYSFSGAHLTVNHCYHLLSLLHSWVTSKFSCYGCWYWDITRFIIYDVLYIVNSILFIYSEWSITGLNNDQLLNRIGSINNYTNL